MYKADIEKIKDGTFWRKFEVMDTAQAKGEAKLQNSHKLQT
jgi:hypothetical protein